MSRFFIDRPIFAWVLALVVMLAGVAHDLKTPLARLRLRAEMMEEVKIRDGVVRDVDSMTHIVEQFLVFAHDGAARTLRNRHGAPAAV